MTGRFGTGADVVLHGRAVDSILSLADRAVSEDVRVGMFLAGDVGSDDEGTFFEIIGVRSSSEGAVGVAFTSVESGTAPSDEDVSFISDNMSRGILMIVDPYACEFAVYLVDDGRVSSANAVMVE